MIRDLRESFNNKIMYWIDVTLCGCRLVKIQLLTAGSCMFMQPLPPNTSKPKRGLSSQIGAEWPVCYTLDICLESQPLNDNVYSRWGGLTAIPVNITWRRGQSLDEGAGKRCSECEAKVNQPFFFDCLQHSSVIVAGKYFACIFNVCSVLLQALYSA